MNYHNIVEFIKQNPICNIATCQGEQPHTRAFLTNIIDDKFYFTTSSTKSVGKQIQHNSKSELCYLKADFSKMLRIETNLKIIDDKNIKQHLIDTKDYLKGFDRDDPTFLLFTLCDSKATFWNIEDNLKEKDIATIIF